MSESPDPPAVLDYAAPTTGQPYSPKTLLLFAACENALLLLCASVILDGGGMLKVAFGLTGCYWLIAAWIIKKGGKCLTRLDRLFLLGGPAILFIPITIILL